MTLSPFLQTDALMQPEAYSGVVQEESPAYYDAAQLSSVPELSPMLTLHGMPVSSGIVIGRAVVMGAASLEVSHYHIAADQARSECDRLTQALSLVRDDLAVLAAQLPEDTPPEMGAFLHVHSLILQDPLIARVPLDLIHQRLYNAEWALVTQGQLLSAQFADMEDDYLRERGADVQQVIERVLQALSGMSVLAPKVQALEGEALIAVAHDIGPADMLRMRESGFAGFATDLGGATSHTTIVARSMGIPAVVGLSSARLLVRDGDPIIIDGDAGLLIVSPSPVVLQYYHLQQQVYSAERISLEQLKDLPAVSRDGLPIQLLANIELPHEAKIARAAGADGIGLFRTEFLFMNRASLPDEQEQYLAYRMVLEAMEGKPVTIRTLDIGADKNLQTPDRDAVVATNPALGLRAIRFCLANPEMFATQLRALLRASVHGHLKILIPMLAHRSEIKACFDALARARATLDQRGQAYAPEIDVGGMIEIPAAAIALEAFIQELDFLSIGTNDLIQYTLAIDRDDPEVAALYDPLHPAVLRLIATTIEAGKKANKPVSICGEMAGDDRMSQLLLGMGLTQFSMHPARLLKVKREIVNSYIAKLIEPVSQTLRHASPVDLAQLKALASSD